VTSEPAGSFEDTAGFLVELARRLHLAGVTASRLEGAIQATAKALRISCEIWSAPTGLLVSLGEEGELRGPRLTRVLRLEPADVDLASLVALDEIAERVIAGKMGVSQAWGEMQALDRRPAKLENVRAIGAFGLAAAAVTALLRTGWTDVAVAGAIGLLIGWLAVTYRRHEHVAPAAEAIAAFVATLLATLFAHFVHPISLQVVVIASLIVLLPGLTLTTAIAELASQQLVTGTTRFAGAVMTLMKLTFGSVAAAQLCSAIGITPHAGPAPSLPSAVEWLALLAASFALATLFKAPRRDMLLVMASAALGYVLTRVGTEWPGFGANSGFAGAVFFSSIVIAALANLYGRVAGRPAALVRVSGIMLLVPGSAGFRGLSYILERDYSLGMETGVAVVNALIALVAGMLFGSLVVPPRRYL
jgi:uncharacterized membrane protein YjjP (DUF1212 family)